MRVLFSQLKVAKEASFVNLPMKHQPKIVIKKVMSCAEFIVS